MTTTEARMTMIFNEWADRYAKNPGEFGEVLGEDGKPVTDYGERCMRYFCKIADEMDATGLLPSPSQANNALSGASGWALYRPDGTMMHVYGQGDMSPEREDAILSRAWEEIRKPDDYAAGTPVQRATDEARRLGYRVVAVTITPNDQALRPERQSERKR